MFRLKNPSVISLIHATEQQTLQEYTSEIIKISTKGDISIDPTMTEKSDHQHTSRHDIEGVLQMHQPCEEYAIQ